MPGTIKDIAKLTGLGLATISSYLNGGTVREKNRVKIEAAIKELDFEVNEIARNLKTNTTKTIGILIPELNNIFFAEIISEVEDILREHGYAAIICDCRSNIDLEKNAVNFLYRKRVDGIIAMPVNKDGSYLSQFEKAGKPIVLIDRKVDGITCDCVLTDNLAAVRNAVSRLVQCGHKKIGFISGPTDVYTAKERLSGYQLACLEHNLCMDESLIVYGDYSIESGAKKLLELYEKNPDMTAVIICNYEMTVGAMIKINELGIKVPETLSVIGFDNLDFARACRPRLEIITQPTKEIARLATEFMLERLKKIDTDARVLKLQTTLVSGKSVATIHS